MASLEPFEIHLKPSRFSASILGELAALLIYGTKSILMVVIFRLLPSLFWN